jgi:uncharacterized protein YceK
MKKILLFLACVTLFVSGCRSTTDDTVTTDPTKQVYAGFRLKSIKVTAVPTLTMDLLALGSYRNADVYVSVEESGSSPFLTSNRFDDVTGMPLTFTTGISTSAANLNKDKFYFINVMDADYSTHPNSNDESMGFTSFRPSDFNGKTEYSSTREGITTIITGDWY